MSTEQLEIISADGKVRFVPLQGRTITIGRSSQNDVTLRDPKVSRMHARLEFDGHQWQITDLNSSTGTFLEGKALIAAVPQPWHLNTTLRIGECRLRLVQAAAPAPVHQVDHQPDRTQFYRNIESVPPQPVQITGQPAPSPQPILQQLPASGLGGHSSLLYSLGAVLLAVVAAGAGWFSSARLGLGSPATTIIAPPLMEASLADLSRELGLEFVYVPAGEFFMGNIEYQVNAAWDQCRQVDPACTRESVADESPQELMPLDDFWIGKHEVTNAQFRAFIEAGGYTEDTFWTEDGWQWRESLGITQPGCWEDARFNQPQQPVVCISWYEALAYANWLSEKTGLPVQLPSEAQWERAARGTDQRTYPWGIDPPTGGRANYCDLNCERADRRDQANNDRYAVTAPVGSYPAGMSPTGALDMAGNVMEWTSTRGGCSQRRPYTYPYQADDGRERLDKADCRVARGGSWESHAVFIRTTERSMWQATARLNTFGFRLAVATQVAPPVVATLQANSIAATAANAAATVSAATEFQTALARLNDRFGMSFIYVPAGEFLMGNSEAQINAWLEQCKQSDIRFSLEDYCTREFAMSLFAPPQHTIFVDGFWISRTEVTNSQYQHFMDSGAYNDRSLWAVTGWMMRNEGYPDPACDDDSIERPEKQPDHPVVCISWYEAVAYTRWLSREFGLPVQLPSEAQWEKAARGTDGRTYPWGEQPADATRLNGCDTCIDDSLQGMPDENMPDGYARIAPVGSYPLGSSPYGVLDMAGNVMEWTSSAWGECALTTEPALFPYPYRPDDGREELENWVCRIVRGGSWNAPLALASSSSRIFYIPNGGLTDLGIRLVIAPK